MKKKGKYDLGEYDPMRVITDFALIAITVVAFGSICAVYMAMVNVLGGH